MTTVWTYPWILDACGIEQELETLASMGVDTIAVASHYHSIQTIAPRSPESKVESYPGGCFFDVDDDRFTGQPITPHQNRIDGLDNPLATICETADRVGLDVAAWTVCNHNTKLGSTNPAYRIQNVYGHSHDHGLCPSRPAVRKYFATVVEAISEYNVNRIDLESIGFPSALHGHGDSFGHSKHHTLTSPVEKVLFSQCFCEGCQDRAANHPVDLDAVQAQIQELLDESIQSPEKTPPSISTLVETEPEFHALFAFRHAVVDDLLAALADASGSTPLNYYVADGTGRGPTDGWPSGIRLRDLDDYLNAVTALCYTDDPEKAGRQTGEIRARFPGVVHTAVTTNPNMTRSKETLTTVAAAAHDEADGELYIYNHSLIGEDQVDWISELATMTA